MSATIRERVQQIRKRPQRWYDWGHPVITLVGRANASTGSFGEVPRPADMWFRKENGKFITTHDYADVVARDDGEWRIFDSQNDGFEIKIGYWPHPDGDGRLSLSGIDGRDEQMLFMRWFVWDGWIKSEWFGLRRWIYYKALHSVVNERIPFSCQQAPPRGAGGYSHWHCQLRKRHSGDHRFRNYTWNSEDKSASYQPQEGK